MDPDKVGRYEILSEIGRGGMAVVYLAQDPHVERKVAIKILPRQLTLGDRLQQRFQDEAKIIASLEHPAIVPVYDYGDFEGQPYLVMRYMTGGSLRERIRGARLTLEQTSRILTRVASALDKAHEKGIIHRDLKPDNILFDEDNRPYLADFGIARMAEATQTVTIIGTPTYMSPEQVHGDMKLDRRCDIYALGVIIFEMLTSRQPYYARMPAKLMMKHILDPVPNILDVNKQLPLGVQQVIERSMAKVPDDRYRSASEVTADLAQLAESIPEQELPSTAKTMVEGMKLPVSPAKAQSRTRMFGWIGFAGLLLVIALFLYIWLVDGRNLPMSSPADPTTDIAAAFVEPRSTPTRTPRPLPSNTPAPTATEEPEAEGGFIAPIDPDTPTGTPTTLPTSTNTVTPMPPQIDLIVSSANLRSGPGTAYSQVGLVYGGDIARIIARNSDSSWLNVELEDGSIGWIATNLTDQQLTVVADISIASTIPARPAPTNTTAASVAQPAATQPPTDGESAGSGNGGGGSNGGDDGGDTPPTEPPPPTAADPKPTAADP